MRTFLLGIFCTFLSTAYSQKNSSIDLSLSGGISTPSSTFADESYATDGSFFNLSSSYYFSTFGVGVSLGQITNPSDKNINYFSSSSAFPTTNTADDWKTFYYGIGPNLKLPLSNFELILNARVGQMNIDEVTINETFDNVDIQIPTYQFSTNGKVSTGYYSTGIKLGYKVTPNLSVFLASNYLSSFSDDIEVSESVRLVQDINKNGVIDGEDFYRDGELIDAQTSTKRFKATHLNLGAGLVYSFRKTPKNKGHHQNPYFQSNELDGDMIAPKNSGSAVFTNASQKDKNQRKIILVTPKNNSSFEELSAMPNFTWKIIGERIMQPKYGVTVEKVSSNSRKISRTYFETSNKTVLNPKAIFKDAPENGSYKWKVTELTTGTTSNYSFFNFSNCEIDFSITNEEIECLGYEGSDRKFKICFDVTYSSPNGDLTYVNPGSGLSAYDQSYGILSPTLVSPNPTLINQIGTTTSTVSYCFEVLVDNTVTQIGFGLQGDDLDPSPIVCQPGVSMNFDELPDCICDECEEIELSFDDFNISLNGASGNQFNFNGNINVNVPIYGIEFQVQSYSYTANPSACSEGVSKVEESGMFLMPGTTINGSTSLQLANETASGSALSNNNATKNIKYTSNAPLSGPIPVNLTIGLPGPISGLDSSCCEMVYTVCIKVLVFYEEGNCKSCVFTHCFEFNNQ